MIDTYEPGTLAVATVRGVPNVRVMRRGKDRWETATRVGGWLGHADTDITDIRPLVVLDLDDPTAYGCSAVVPGPEKIVQALRNTNSVAAHAIANQIEAQTKPPRIPEPGLWAVVEAYPGARAGDPVHMVRDSTHEDAAWRSLGDGSTWEWDCLLDPVLIRDGIEGGA